MKKMITSKRGRRFDEGGEVDDKSAGLAASNKEPSIGFFERLRMGNIDDPSSEAYKRFGAGRGRADRIPVADVTPTPVTRNQPSSEAAPNRTKTYETGTPNNQSGSYFINENPDYRQSATEEMLNPEKLGKLNESKKYNIQAPSDAGSSLGRLSPYTEKKKTTSKPAALPKKEEVKKEKKSESSTSEPAKESVVKKKPVTDEKTFNAYDLNNFSSAKAEAEKPKSTYKKNSTYAPSGKKSGTSKSSKENDVDFGGFSLGMKRGGSVSKASGRADGIAQRGKTRGVMR
jgi:hypothetical protein